MNTASIGTLTMKLNTDNSFLMTLDETGKFRYLTKTHPDLIPLILFKNGKSVSVSGERLVVKEDSKRKILNTPSKHISQKSVMKAHSLVVTTK